MAETLPLRRLKRTLVIHRLVQIVLCVLLAYMALHFQQLFAAKGMPQVFRNSLLATLLVQFALFFPLRRLASNEARRDLAAARPGATPELLQQLRRQRLYGDTIKGAIFLAFFTFVIISPPVTFVLATTLFSFIATVVTYLQCFNFAVRRGLAGQSDS